MCTLEKRGNLFILTLTGGPTDEHRFNPTTIDAIKSALSQAKSQATPDSALVTTSQGRFFSNGFDLAWAQSQSSGSLSGFTDKLHYMVEYLKPVVALLLSLPFPTIAAVSGHAAAAGFLFALSHDYVLMRKDKGVLYMSELDIGMTFPEYFTALFKSKVGNPAARRDVLLAAKKLKADEAVELGIIHSAYDSGESTVEAAVRLGEQLASRKWNGDVYAEIRKALFPEICAVLGLTPKSIVAPKL